ncbi:MAG: cell division protein ZapA [Lachnospiraceae bacterium]|nr:cell division protein ZapA [Lachnospiraceae bacterium]MDD6618280.1 cell division protein ZapA [Clostridiales bacterium]MDY4769643.1 cell division protein ZapA [Lachnospiraceae bacterium]
MAAKNSIKVLIGGKIITLSGYESEEYLQKVALYMDSKITELSSLPGYSRQPMETKHMLLSLNISDDYFKAKKQAEVFEQDLKAKDQEMYDLKHELVSLQVELDNAKASSKEFENKAKELEGKAKQLETEINKLRRKQ